MMKCMNEVSAGKLSIPVQLLWKQDNTNQKEPKLKLSLEICASEEVTVVYCRGRIVYRDEAAAFSARMAELVKNSRHVVLDFSELETIDGAGLGELAKLLLRTKNGDCVVRIAAPSRSVYELLTVTHLASAFDVHSSVEEALLSVREQVA